MRLKIFTFCAVIFATQHLAAQSFSLPRQPYVLPEFSVVKPFFSDGLRLNADFATPPPLVTPRVRNVYNYEDLAIFCRLEVKAERAAGFPVKFRLGEVNYVEQLEGKPYSIF
jgi:hypothetical protein